jgi:hypothetical protein
MVQIIQPNLPSMKNSLLALSILLVSFSASSQRLIQDFFHHGDSHDRVATGEVNLSAIIDQESPVVGCGQPVTLTATIIGAAEIGWKRNGEFINGATTTTFIANQSGIYSVVAISLLCEIESASVEVILESPLNAAILTPSGTSACAGNTVQLQASGGNAQWQWYRNGMMVADGNNELYNASISGSYTVTGNESSVCASTSLPVEVVINPLPEVLLIWEGNSSICDGDSSLIAAQLEPLEEILWFHDESPVGSETPTLFATENGEYQAVVTNSTTGCSAPSNSLFLQVALGQEVVIASVAETTFCEGQSTSLTLTSGQGAIEWINNGQVIPNEMNGALSVSNAGSYSAQITGDNGCVSESNEINIEVSPLPNTSFIFEGMGFLCGVDDTLDVSVEEGNTYEWYADGVLLNNASGASLSITEPGEYAVFASDSIGCTSTSQPLVIELATLPELTLEPSGNINLCADQVQYFEAISSGAIQFEWYLNGILINDATSDYFEATMAGEYSVLIVDNNGCTTQSSVASMQVLTVETPVITDGGITSQGQLLLAGEASGHQWYLDSEPIQGATGLSYLATENGVYTVVSIEDVCESLLSDGFSVVLGNVSEDEFTLLAYPNPSNEVLVIEHPALAGEEFFIYDSAGALVKQDVATHTRTQMDVRMFSHGIYHLITSSGFKTTFSVVH